MSLFLVQGVHGFSLHGAHPFIVCPTHPVGPRAPGHPGLKAWTERRLRGAPTHCAVLGDALLREQSGFGGDRPTCPLSCSLGSFYKREAPQWPAREVSHLLFKEGRSCPGFESCILNACG